MVKHSLTYSFKFPLQIFSVKTNKVLLSLHKLKELFTGEQDMDLYAMLFSTRKLFMNVTLRF